MNRERGRKGEEEKFFTSHIYKDNIRGSVHRLPSGWMTLSCPVISQSNCEKAGQDE